MVPTIPGDEPGDNVRRDMTLHYLRHAQENLNAARNQLIVQRDGARALRKLQDKAKP